VNWHDWGVAAGVAGFGLSALMTIRAVAKEREKDTLQLHDRILTLETNQVNCGECRSLKPEVIKLQSDVAHLTADHTALSDDVDHVETKLSSMSNAMERMEGKLDILVGRKG
jgi:uncharacterized protein YlxW (UPF0749 family)